MRGKRLVSTVLIWALALGSLSACGGRTEAVKETEVSTEVRTEAVPETQEIETAEGFGMKLSRVEGSVSLTDELGTTTAAMKNTPLADGYELQTAEISRAWVEMDEADLLIADEFTDCSFQKDGKKLQIRVEEGKLFFCIMEPLEADESLEFIDGNGMIGIHGTTGIINVVSENETDIVLLEGKIEGTLPDGTIYEMETGNVSVIRKAEDGSFERTERPIYEEDIPDFVRAELNTNTEVQRKVLSSGGSLLYEKDPNPAAAVPSDGSSIDRAVFEEALRRLTQDEEYPDGSGLDGTEDFEYAIVDVTGDGREELLIHGGFYQPNPYQHYRIFEWEESENSWQMIGDFCLGGQDIYDNGIVLDYFWKGNEFTGLNRTVYRYDAGEHRYQEIAFVIDVNLNATVPAMSYSTLPNSYDEFRAADTDGDKHVYAVRDENETDPKLLTDEEYDSWLSELTEGRDMIEIEYTPLS